MVLQESRPQRRLVSPKREMFYVKYVSQGKMSSLLGNQNITWENNPTFCPFRECKDNYFENSKWSAETDDVTWMIKAERAKANKWEFEKKTKERLLHLTWITPGSAERNHLLQSVVRALRHFTDSSAHTSWAHWVQYPVWGHGQERQLRTR